MLTTNKTRFIFGIVVFGLLGCAGVDDGDAGQGAIAAGGGLGDTAGVFGDSSAISGEVDSDRQVEERQAQLEAISINLEERGELPAGELVIDGSVHTGYPWAGETYEGVMGSPFLFALADYPITWALALAHGALLAFGADMPVSPNRLLALAVASSRLGCVDEQSDAYPTGCLALEKSSAFVELQRMFPDRFQLGYEELIGGAHFETAALAAVHYLMLTQVWLSFYDEVTGPDGLMGSEGFDQLLLWTYRNDLFFEQFSTMSQCPTVPLECAQGTPVAVDFVQSVLDLEKGLDGAAPFAGQVTLDDLLTYWSRVSVLFPEVTYAQGALALEQGFARAAGEQGVAGAISFDGGVLTVLSYLQALLQPESAPVLRDRLCQHYWDRLPSNACGDLATVL